MTRSRVPRRGLIFAVAIAGTLLACAGKGDAPKVPLTQAGAAGNAQQEIAAHSLLGSDARAALDSGNVLFRKRAYAAALDQYRAASAMAPQHVAPLFGIYMVARATNNTSMADSALAEIRVRSGAMPTAPHSLSDTALKRLRETSRSKATSS